ncbi:Hypothetical predicted protein [Mytilus galloprovincialis]|uniref:Uncharacterized protein n=1 Tax=Mytilus galloprovincialis TaxID=29158 RepID=A0A8B6H597_MYTGA|nr:Hypothetical predicted protein [Mytilus galloprovincialis]
MEGIGQYKKQLTENDKKWIKGHKSIQSTLLKKIDNIIRNPEEFLTEDLLEVVDEKHLHELEKTIGEVE